MADMMNQMAGAMPAPTPEQAPAAPTGPQGDPAVATPQQGIPGMFPILDGPTPGQSLLTEPKSQAWERPPQYSDPQDAADYVWRMLTKPAVTKSTLTMLDQGVPVEALARTLVFKGFSDGKWSIDTGMLIFRSVNLMIASLGKAAGINIKIPIKERDPLDPIRNTYRQVAKNDLTPDKPEQGIDMLETTEDTEPAPMLARKGNK
jgi:hypothetical protein